MPEFPPERSPDVPTDERPGTQRRRTVSRGGIDLDELLAPQHIYTPSSGGLLARFRAGVATKRQNREDTTDRALADRSLRGQRDGVTMTFASAKGGAGKTAMCRGVADILTERRFGPVAVLEADLDLGTIGESAPAIARPATLLDVWRDRGKITSAGKLQRYLTRFPSGAVLMPAPTDIAEIEQVTVEVLGGVLALLEEHYPIVAIDASPGLGIHNPIVAWAYEVATHIVAVAPARRATVKQLEMLLAYLDQTQPEKPITAVLNQVPGRSSPVNAIVHAARQVGNGQELREVPHDPLLDYQLDAANLDIARLGQSTRVAVKELALALADTWARQPGRR